MSIGQEEVTASILNSDDGSSFNPFFSNFRGVQWRINLGILPHAASPIDDLRRAAANSRRRYADLRTHLLVDPYVAKNRSEAANLAIDNPLSQNPDSMWGRFFRNAELEKILDQDLSRLYPEHGSYFQTPACQAMLRRILLLWCLKYPDSGHKQGMHELLAPLLYVLHVDVQRLVRVRKLHENHFNDRFDGMSVAENIMEENRKFSNNNSHLFTNQALQNGNDDSLSGSMGKLSSLDELDPDVRTTILASDVYGAEGELGILLSERFMEHDAYCMFDALMSGAGSVVVMADFFSSSPSVGSLTGLPPVIEASSSLYHLLSIVDASLYCHLMELGVEPQYFALRWLRVLFGREFLLEDLLVIWDAIFESPNDPLDSNDDDESRCGIARSYRGTFISAMAVSMLLQLRSSLLATENATSCLQRLLNFPQNVDVRKLIERARSLQVLSLDTSISLPPSPSFYNRSRSSTGRARSFSSPLRASGSLSPGASMGPVPESYWEEKWKISLLQRPNVQKSGASNLSAESGKLGKTQISLVKGDPCANNLKNGKRDPRTSMRRLVDELVQEVGSNRAFEESDPQGVSGGGSSGSDLEVQKGPEGQIEENGKDKDFASRVVVACSGRLPICEDSLRTFSTSTSCLGQDADNEKFSEKSSIDTVLSDEIDEAEANTVEETCTASNLQLLPNFNSTEATERVIGSEADVWNTSNLAAEKQAMSFKDRKLSSKFQWFWKFGRNSDKGKTIKGGDIERKKSTKAGSGVLRDHPGLFSAEALSPLCLPSSGTDSADKNLMATLRSLGQSMLENIQVIESSFHPERSQVGTSNLPRNILGVKGQVTALAALKELRKISNLLSEM